MKIHTIPPELIRVALEDAPDAMLIVDTAGIVRYANHSVTDLFGRPHDEVIGRGVEALMPERFRARHSIYRAEFVRDRKSRRMGDHGADLYGLRADGSEFPVAISLKTVSCESESFVVGAIRDVTDQVRTTRKLKEARERADRANKVKTNILTLASHDLRQPLQSALLSLAGQIWSTSPSSKNSVSLGKLCAGEATRAQGVD